MRRRVLALLLGVWSLAGCGVHIGADPARVSLSPVYPPAEAWPALRDGSRDESELTLDWVVEAAPDDRGGAQVLFREPVYTVEYSERFGSCTVRELRRIGAAGRRAREVLIDVEVAIDGQPQTREFVARLKGDYGAPFAIIRGPMEVTGRLAPGVDLEALSQPSRYGPAVERLVRDRAFTFQRPIGGPARGIILHLRAFADNPFESSVIDEFRRRGWAVLSGNFATSLSSVGRYEVFDERSLPAVAGGIAAAIDRVCAERAYTFEAALAYVATRHPEIPMRPAAIVGFSAGSLGVPTVAARLPGRLDAGVIICGGADLLSISQRNPLARIGLWVTSDGRSLDGPALARLSAAYLAASGLDPFATAPAMAGIPVLLIHAKGDREVPADTGDVLYERLGRPERWVYGGGHSWVFLLLPRLKGEIARWLERAVGEGSEGGGH
jgi:predicted esterase